MWSDAVRSQSDMESIGFSDDRIVSYKNHGLICAWPHGKYFEEGRMHYTIKVVLALYATRQLSDLSSPIMVTRLLECRKKIKSAVKQDYNIKDNVLKALLVLYHVHICVLQYDEQSDLCNLILDVDKLEEKAVGNEQLTELLERL